MDKKCPYCRSKNIKIIIYGYPSEEQIMMEAKGEAILGGCVIGKNSPNFFCKDCNKYFRFEQLKTLHEKE